MSSETMLRIHHILPRSRANGPGIRLAIWLQGCTLGCPGCFNPETHPTQAGSLSSVDEVFERIHSTQHEIEGITISGGEPLQQRKPLLSLLRLLRQHTRLSVVLFTGFEEDELKKMPGIEDLFTCIDVLIAGRYRAPLRLASGLRGSANKTIRLYSDRYRMEEITTVPEAEVVLAPNGDVLVSGIDPLVFEDVHP